MKLYGIFICKWKGYQDPVILSSAQDLLSFQYFSRASVKEFMIFFSRTLAKRCQAGSRQQVEEKEYVFYVQKKLDGLAAILICDSEYPSRVAFTFLSKTVTEYAEAHKGQIEASILKDECISAPELERILAKYQNPAEADKLLQIQKDLDDTKVILHQAIDGLLERGEKLDDLVAKSGDLGMASKSFYKTAKKNNSCCVLM
jgi:synaptobrevin family protein YKT6